MERVNSNDSLVDLLEKEELPHKQKSDCTAATYEGSDASNSPHQTNRKTGLTRKSLVDRARVFDKNFHDSFDEGLFNTLTLESQTSAEVRVLQKQQQEMMKFGNSSLPLPGAHHFVSPTLTKEQRELLEGRVKKNLKEEPNLLQSTRTRRPPTIPPKHTKVGKNMKALLDASQHRRDQNVLDRAKLRNWKPKPVSTEPPKPPPEVQFKNVVAPPLKIDPKTFKPTVHPKTEFQRKLILKAIKNTFVLKDNNEETDNALISSMEKVDIRRNEVLMRQGEAEEKDDSMYIVGDGKVEFQVDGVTVDTALPGTAFGQERLLIRGANKATIKASCKSTLFKLDQQTFRGIMQQQQEALQKERNRELREQQTLTEEEETKSDEEKKTEFRARGTFGKKAVEEPKSNKSAKQGTSPAPAAAKKGASKSKETTVVKKKKKPAMDFSFEDSEIFQRQKKIRESVKKHAPKKEDLEFISVLGEGQFGEVWLVAANLPDIDPTRQEFAYKIQQKYDDIREDATDVIKREIDVLREIHHPFIVDMVNVYETDDSLDMLLGLIQGGELWDIIHKEQDDGEWVSGIPEKQAKFYTYILTDIFAFLASKQILFRDMKPENVMIDQDGYPILVDFGFAKHVKKGELAFTFCGTPNYVAPEIIKSVGHGAGVDHWALGVVIYEMISGENPFFYDEMDQTELFRAISEDEQYAMPKDKEASMEAIDLIDQLLIKDPTKRLGVNGVQDIAAHPWFTGMPALNLLRSKKVTYDDFMAGNFKPEEASVEEMDDDFAEDEFVQALEDDDDIIEEDLNDMVEQEAPKAEEESRKRGSWIGEDVGRHLKHSDSEEEKWAKPLDGEGNAKKEEEEEMETFVTIRNGKKTVVTLKAGERPPWEREARSPIQRRSSFGERRRTPKAEKPKRNFSSDDVDLFGLGGDGSRDGDGEGQDTEPQHKKVEDFTSPVYKKYGVKGSLKGYYAVMKSPEEKKISKNRRKEIGGFLDNLGLDDEDDTALRRSLEKNKDTFGNSSCPALGYRHK